MADVNRGACCNPSGRCSYVSEDYCSKVGGTYRGDNVACDGIDCEGRGEDRGDGPLGVCCDPWGFEETCGHARESVCNDAGGYWLGSLDFWSCDPNPCARGACCHADDAGDEGACTDDILGHKCITEYLGYPFEGQSCQPNSPCNQPLVWTKLPYTFDGNHRNEFGAKIAVSSDNSWMIVGAPAYGPSSDKHGKAHIFKYDSVYKRWNEHIVLSAPDEDDWTHPSGNGFGSVVSIDGNVAIVSARSRLDGNPNKVFIYRYNGVTWVLEQTLEESNPVGTSAMWFGNNSILSKTTSELSSSRPNINDGTTTDPDILIVGSSLYWSESSSIKHGRVYIYNYIGSEWTLVQSIDNPEPQNGPFFGKALAEDRNWLLIGAYRGAPTYPDQTGLRKGVVYVYKRQGGMYFYTGTELYDPTGQEGDNFGEESTISINGDWIVVGAPEAGTYTRGEQYAFHLENNNWVKSQEWKRMEPFGPNGNSWWGCSISIKNNFMAIGARYHGGGNYPPPHDGHDSCFGAGAFTLYKHNKIGVQPWRSVAHIESPEPECSQTGVNDEGSQFGAQVVVTNEKIIVGAKGGWDISPSIYKGEVYVYDFPTSDEETARSADIPEIPEEPQLPPPDAPGVKFDEMSKKSTDEANGCDFPLPDGSDFIFNKDGIDSSDNFMNCDRGFAMSDNGKWLACGYSANRTLSSGGTQRMMGAITCDTGWPENYGACCHGDDCTYDTILDCFNSGGIFIGVGVSCIPPPCGDSPPDECICFPGNITCEQKVISSDGSGNDKFGISVSISDNWAIVGAKFKDDMGDNSGAAYIYRLSGNQWVEEVKLLASDGAETDYFGAEVSISGSIALVSSHGDDDMGDYTGSAYVFVYKTDIGWGEDSGAEGVRYETQKLLADDVVAGDRFGKSLSTDGNKLLITSVGSNSFTGAAYVYKFNGSQWLQEAKLLASDGEENDNFGGVNPSILNNTVMVTSHGYGSNLGAVYVYTFNGGDWGEDSGVAGVRNENQKLEANDGEIDDYFGSSVSISGDTAMIMAAGNLSLYVFRFDGSQWNEVQQIPFSAGSTSYNVSISGDIAVLGSDDDDIAENAGAAYVYHFNGSQWVELTKLIASDGAEDNWFGSSVSVIRDIDGYRVLIGAHSNDNGNGISAGAAYFYKCDIVAAPPVQMGACCVGSSCIMQSPEDCTTLGGSYFGDGTDCNSVNCNCIETKLLASDGASGDYFGYSVAVDGDTVVVGAYGDDDDGSASGSAYVYRFDGSSWIETKLLASDGASGDWFGYSVAVDGDTVVVGAYGDDDDGSASGSAYVYRFDGSSWIETKLLASDGASGGNFGVSVAISGDTLVVGAVGDDDNGAWSGSAYVYRFDGNNWIETKLIASDGENGDYFGTSVGISGDTIVVGANDYGGSSSPGSAYVYQFDGSNWIETKLLASDGENGDYFGVSVAISGDTIVVGASYDHDNGSQSGSAYIYKFDGTNWIETKLLASDGENFEHFGTSVAVSGDTVVVGAKGDTTNGLASGSTYVYRFDGTDWLETKLLASDGAINDYFGIIVAVDGDTVVVGAWGNDDYGEMSGSAYIYKCYGSIGTGACCVGSSCIIKSHEDCTTLGGSYFGDGTTCDVVNCNCIETKLLASDGASGDYFGWSVAVSGDTIVVGAYLDDDNGSSSGSAYIYRFDGSSWNETKLLASDGSSDDYFGGNVAVDGDTVVVGAFSDDDSGINFGSAYVYRFDGTDWNETKLTADDGAQQDQFGISVSVSGDTVVVGAHLDNNNGPDSGSAYVYRFDGSNWIETKLIASDVASLDRFGYSVAVDGDTIVVGAYRDNDNGYESGSAYIYRFDGSNWIETKLIASDGSSSDRFGYSVATSGDTVVVGAPQYNGSAMNSGIAYVYRFDGSDWNEETKLTASGSTQNDYFGNSVAVSGDGDMVVIGQYFGDDNGAQSGAAYIYRFDGSVWEETKLTASDGAEGDHFGRSVAVDGDTVVVGAYLDDDNGSSSGSAYIYQCESSGWSGSSGACCIGSDCQVLSPEDCATAGGEYLGDDATCEADTCEITSPYGACCYGYDCVEGVIEGDCSGVWLGEGSSCVGSPCGDPPCQSGESRCLGATCYITTDDTCCGNLVDNCSHGACINYVFEQISPASSLETANQIFENSFSVYDCAIVEKFTLSSTTRIAKIETLVRGGNGYGGTDGINGWWVNIYSKNPEEYNWDANGLMGDVYSKKFGHVHVPGDGEPNGWWHNSAPGQDGWGGYTGDVDSVILHVEENEEGSGDKLILTAGEYWISVIPANYFSANGQTYMPYDSTSTGDVSVYHVNPGYGFGFGQWQVIDTNMPLRISVIPHTGDHGACCWTQYQGDIENLFCSDWVSIEDCDCTGGTYLGDNTYCEEDHTSQCSSGLLGDPTPGVGACCLNDGRCEQLNVLSCESVGGYFYGTGTDCENYDCSEHEGGEPRSYDDPIGACCINNNCFTLTENECSESSGFYIGDNTNCDDSPCSSANYERVYTEEIAIYKMNDQTGRGDGSAFDLVAVVPYPYDARVDILQETTSGYFLNAINGNCFNLEEYDISMNENGTLLSLSGYTLRDDGVRFPHILTWHREDYAGHSWSLVQDTRFLDWSGTVFNNASAFKNLVVNRGRVMALAYQFDNESTKIMKVDAFDRSNPADISLSTVVDASDPQSSLGLNGIYTFDVTVGYIAMISDYFDSLCLVKESFNEEYLPLHWDYDILSENHTDLSVLEELSLASYDAYSGGRSNPEMFNTPNATHVKIKNFSDNGICLVTNGSDSNMSIDVYRRKSNQDNFGMDQLPSDWTISDYGLPQNPHCAYQKSLDANNRQRGLYCKHISESTGLCMLSDPKFGSGGDERGRVYPYLFLGEEDENGYEFILCHTKNMPPVVNGISSSGIEYGGKYSSGLFGFSCFGYEVESKFYFASFSCSGNPSSLLSFYEFDASRMLFNKNAQEEERSASGIFKRYILEVSPSRWDKKFKTGYVGFSSEEVRDSASISISSGKINIIGGDIVVGDEGIIYKPLGPGASEGDSEPRRMASGHDVPDVPDVPDDSPLSTEVVSDKSQSIYQEFGILIHDDGFGGSVGDGSILSLDDSTISAKADSVTGIFEIKDTLTKYDSIKVDIKHAAFKDTGSASHIVIEDTFEGVNSGLPSFLSQVQQLNILRGGLQLKRTNPYDFDNFFAPYQSKYVLSCDTGWYDIFNSTIDFYLQKQNNPLGISLSFPSTIFEKEKDNLLWVGGPDGVLQIHGSDYSVSIPEILIDYDLSNIIKINQIGSEIFILSQDKLVIVDEQDNTELDPLYGISGRLTDVTRVYNGTYIISTSNGIYSRMSGSASYTKVYEKDVYGFGELDKFFLLEDIAGFVFGVSENAIHITSNGNMWGMIDGVLPNTEINNLQKFRSGHVLLTNFGAFYDNGSLLDESFNFQLLPVLGPVGSGVDNSGMKANDAGGVVSIAEDGSIIQSELVIVFADGSYSISTTSLDAFNHYEQSGFLVIHKIIRFQNRWLIFSFDNFKFIDDTKIYRLSTGLRV